MNPKMLSGLARHAIAAACVAVITAAFANHTITVAQINALLAHWPEAVAAGGFVGSVLWSLLSKRDQKVAQEVQDAAASLGVDANSLEDFHQVLLKAATTNAAITTAGGPSPAPPLQFPAQAKPAIPSALPLLLFICGLSAFAVAQSACTTTAAGSSTAQVIQANTQAAVVDLLTADPSARADVTAVSNGLADALTAQEFSSTVIMAEVGKYLSATSKAYGVINDIVAQSAPDLAAIAAGVTGALKATAPLSAPAPPAAAAAPSAATS